MFGSASPTPYDLRFAIGRIPVRVHPLFWLFSALLGWSGPNLQKTLLWVLCVFLSVLIHELGHAWTAQSFGLRPQIVLHAFGGYAAYHLTGRQSTWQRILILIAGPAAGFALLGLATLGLFAVTALRQSSATTSVPPQLITMLVHLCYINLWWGVLNLLPIYPLDGGQIAREVLRWWSPWRGLNWSLWLSLVCGGLLAFYFFRQNQHFTGLMFASMAFESLQSLQNDR